MTDESPTNRFGKLRDPKAPYMTPEEAAYLTEMYQKAGVILEYGSGGSTRIAAAMPGKTVFSVESDAGWAQSLQAEIDASEPASPATVYHVDIGPVGRWGRPTSEENWRKFQRYPTQIWGEPFFRHPDLILIDGRMRCACLVYAMMMIEKPTEVLFDDYMARGLYRRIERIVKPKRIIGAMAHFEIDPGSLKKEDMAFAIGQFFLGASEQSRGDDFYESETPL